MRNLLIALSVILLLTACELERTNPLDPQNNGEIEVPGIVTDVNITSSGSGSTTKWVEIEWSRKDNVAGYYVYRALSYDGSYTNLTPNGIPNTSNTPYFNDNSVYAGNYYYYRLSAFSSEGLEGPLSAPSGASVE